MSIAAIATARRIVVQAAQHLRKHYAAWLMVAAVVASSVMLVRVYSFFWRYPGPFSIDDGYTVALAERIIDRSWLPYVDGSSHRGPLLYWTIALFQVMSGRFNWYGPIAMCSLVSIATLLAVAAAGIAARKPLAAAVGALLHVWLLSVYDTAAAFGPNGENIAAPLALTALAAVTLAITRAQRVGTRAALMFAGGFLGALAGLTKQTALPAFVPLLAWAAVFALTNDAVLGKRRFWPLLALCGGFAVPLLVVLLRYAAAGELSTFWYWYFTYNREIYMAPHRGDSLRTVFDPLFEHRKFAMLGLAVVVLTTVSARVAGIGKRPWNIGRACVTSGFELTLAATTIVLLVGALAPLRFFYQYFVTLFPFAALLVGSSMERAIAGASAARSSHAVAAALAVVGVAGATLYAHDYSMRTLLAARRNGAWKGVHPEPVCDFVNENSRPDASLFVWGFAGDFYITCRRRPATRFTYLTLVAGVVPDRSWQGPNPKYVAKGSREQVIRDLRESRPGIILDMPGTIINVSLQSIPEMATFVNENYCKRPALTTKDGRTAIPYVLRAQASCG